jgi:hypothetical protein
MFAILVCPPVDGKSFRGVVKSTAAAWPERHGLVDNWLWLQDYYLCSGTIIGTTSVERACVRV